MNRRSFLSCAGLLALFAPTLPRMLWELSDPYVIDPTGRRDSTRGIQRAIDRLPAGGTLDFDGARIRIDRFVSLGNASDGITIRNLRHISR